MADAEPSADQRIYQHALAFRRFASAVLDGHRALVPGSDGNRDMALTGSEIMPTGIVDSLVGSAADHLMAFADKIGADGTDADELTFSLFADYTLFRPVIEGLASALWLLTPEDPLERVRRAWRIVSVEFAKSDQYVARMASAATNVDAQAQLIERAKQAMARAGQRAGMSASETSRFRGVDPSQVVREVDRVVDGSPLETFRYWATCSAHAHAQIFTVLGIADREPRTGPHGEYVFAQLNSEEFARLCDFVFRLVNSTVRMLNRRGFTLTRDAAIG